MARIATGPPLWYIPGMPATTHTEQFWLLIAVVLSIGVVFITDLCLPLGIAGGVPYAGPVVLSLWLSGRRRLEIVTALCAVLTILGAWLSPPGSEPLWMVALNRAFALFVMALVLVVGGLQRRLLAQNRTLSSQTAALETLYEIGAGLSALLDVKTIKETAVSRIRGLLHCDAAGLALLHEGSDEIRWELLDGASSDAYQKLRIRLGECVGGRVIQSGRPLILQPLAPEPGLAKLPLLLIENLRAVVVVPVQIAAKPVGALLAARRTTAPFDEQDLHLLTALANQVAVATNNARLYERLGAVSTMLERERLAHELHDGLAQVLGYITATASTAAELAVQKRWDEVERHVARLSEVAQTANLDVREAIGELQIGADLRDLQTPGELLRWLAEQEHIALDVEGELNLSMDLPPAVEVQAIRIIQEALRNVRKHAGVCAAKAQVTAVHPWLTVILSDQGKGFDLEQVSRNGHYGLRTMQERAAAVGGSLSVTSAPGAGTLLTLQLPLHEDA